MMHTSPAIVAQAAVRPLPRKVLWLLCAVYVLAGFFGRDPWRGDDMQAFAFMREIALGQTGWLQPTLVGLGPDTPGLLPLWLGAGAIWLGQGWLSMEATSRLPFVALLVLVLASTWRAAWRLAQSREAQPVAFAFGGEARAVDYARAMADAALLALIATLGLAQFSHEATSYLSQLAGTALLLSGSAAWLRRPDGRALAATLGGVALLALSGAPSMALLLAAGAAGVATGARTADGAALSLSRTLAAFSAQAAAIALLAFWTQAWQWRLALPASAQSWATLARLLVWFAWPTWLLALWTLWRWRHPLRHGAGHILLPLWFALVPVVAAFTTEPADRALLQGLPALAILAAFALPTLKRGVAAAIDWFTLLFFSVCAIAIWVVWLAVQTGFPAQPAANVARLAPGFHSRFEPLAFVLALAATLAWCALVRWRTARHRPAIWKSLALPAGGAALGWVLLMTLWLPLLDYGRSYAPQVRLLREAVDKVEPGSRLRAGDCVAGYGLDQPLVAALRYYGQLPMATPEQAPTCRWAIVDPDGDWAAGQVFADAEWQQAAIVTRPTDRRDQLVLMLRRPAR
ncbi:hypothetical protein KUD94_08170 [Comamonas sp. NLF-1-9]|nr:hypothetical protein [Comamonas sp. NLF-1-9]QXL85862.1 hypothetical protein KUD94_08170 [Comamonas sp. NLF-1-9]